MAGRRKGFPNITAAEAHAALRWLMATGKVTAAEIWTALREREALAAEIRAKLEALGGEGLRFLRGPEGLQRRIPGRQVKRRVSAARQAAWRIQGRYLGALRHLSAGERKKVAAIREKRGVGAAIAAARKIGKGQ